MVILAGDAQTQNVSMLRVRDDGHRVKESISTHVVNLPNLLPDTMPSIG